ncbi:MAG: hypothetical protein DRG83_03620 [Deltaproteobacteria bacterium]|nr:MAG: hypothetical protein DRG83_03620 [Deltaproteobacteria bacterium]
MTKKKLIISLLCLTVISLLLIEDTFSQNLVRVQKYKAYGILKELNFENKTALINGTYWKIADECKFLKIPSAWKAEKIIRLKKGLNVEFVFSCPITFPLNQQITNKPIKVGNDKEITKFCEKGAEILLIKFLPS